MASGEMEKVLVVTPEKCTGCHTCELTCSFLHYGVFSPVRSRITVFNFERVGFSTPIVCQQCSPAACMQVCPVGAISQDDKTRAKVVDKERCLRCQMCTIACPFGATFFDPVFNEILKCDLCGGDPECVKLCPSGAISYVEATSANINKRRAYAARFKDLSKEVG